MIHVSIQLEFNIALGLLHCMHNAFPSKREGLFAFFLDLHVFMRFTLTDLFLKYFVFFPDLHNTSNIAEVEIISLLEEKIPLYKLRADTATGYAYDDWLGSSLGTVLEEGENEEEEDDGRYDLSPEMMEETLKYFSKYKIYIILLTKILVVSCVDWITAW